MKTIDRYVAGLFLKNLGLGITALGVLLFFVEMLGALMEHRYSPGQLVFYNLLNLPHLLVHMTPPAVMMTTVMTLSSLARTNELVACKSIGIGIDRLVGLLLTIVFIVSCIVLIFQDRILPPTFKTRMNYYWREMEKKRDFHLDIKQDKIWYRSKNLIYNLRTFDQKSRTILGMSVYTFDDQFNLIQAVEAEKAEFTNEGWKLKNGTVTLFSKSDPFPLTKKFDEKTILIAETPKDFQEIEKEVDGLRLKELYRYIGKMKQAGADTKAYEVKFHSRISLSFIPLVMCILGVPFATRGRREGGVARDLGLCLGVTFFYWLFYSVGLSLGSNGALPPWLAAWLPSVIFGALAVALISRREA